MVGFFRDAEHKQQPSLWELYLGYPQTVSDKSKGFNDPNEVYPQKENSLSGHALNESDVNRLARNDTDQAHAIVKAKMMQEQREGQLQTQQMIPPILQMKNGQNKHQLTQAYIRIMFTKQRVDILKNLMIQKAQRIHEYHKSGTFYEVDASIVIYQNSRN